MKNLTNKTLILQYIKDQYNLQIDSFKQVDNRISNRLAILAAFLIIIIATLNQFIFIYQNSKIGFIILLISFIALFISFNISIYYILKILIVDIYKPYVPDNTNILNDNSDDEIILNTFIMNYSKAFDKNEELLSKREVTGELFIKWNKRLFFCLVLYIFCFGSVRIFITTTDQITKVEIIKNKLEVIMPEENKNTKSSKQQKDEKSKTTVTPKPDQTIKVSPNLSGEPRRVKFAEDEKSKTLKKPYLEEKKDKKNK